MDFTQTLDSVISEALELGCDERQISDLLFSEAHIVEGMELTEARRIRVKVAGGGYMTKRVIGRKDPRRSAIAKRAARKGKANRMRAMRNPRSKMKRQRTLAARKRMMGPARRPRRGGTPRTVRRRR